mgnify:CR=1 FL=1
MKRPTTGLLVPLAAMGQHPTQAKPGVTARLWISGESIPYDQAREMGVDFRVLGLRDVKLHGTAAEVLNLVRSCGIRTRFPWPDRIQHSWPDFRLYVENEQESKQLSEKNNDSARLGIALAVLAFLNGKRLPAVAATGGLASRPKQPRDLEVTPVGLIAQKLTLITQAVEANPKEGPWHVFLPRMGLSAENVTEPVETAHKAALEHLRRLGAEIHPVDTLREAAGILGIGHLAEPPRLVQGRRIAAGMLVAGALAGGAAAWLSRPIDIVPAHPKDRQPVRMVLTDDQRSTVTERAPCVAEELPAYRAGEQIRLDLAARRGGEPTRVHHALVTLDREEGVKVTPGQQGTDGRMIYDIPVITGSGRGALLVLAWHAWPRDPETIQRAARDAMAGAATEGERLKLAVNRLAGMAPGHAAFFVTLLDADDPRCLE